MSGRRTPVPRTAIGAVFLVAAFAANACTPSRVPDPREAARAYARAAARGDAAAIYSMLTAQARRERSEAEIRRTVGDERDELADQARALTAPDTRVEATARLRFSDGEEASLDLRNGRYLLTAAGSLPGGALTPAQALDQLRRVLARRSYPGLMRVLSSAARTAVESDVRNLVDGLDEPDSLPVQVNGDSAVVPVPGGHRVKLKREGGVWRVDDFD